ncbi:MAG: hypothetical protein V1908_00990 [Candidatus Peregrinibacteria bacterium]
MAIGDLEFDGASGRTWRGNQEIPRSAEEAKRSGYTVDENGDVIKWGRVIATREDIRRAAENDKYW